MLMVLHNIPPISVSNERFFLYLASFPWIIVITPPSEAVFLLLNLRGIARQHTKLLLKEAIVMNQYVFISILSASVALISAVFAFSQAKASKRSAEEAKENLERQKQ
ncbi:hypothetical protein H1R82_10495 [Thermoactinomyces intermedius]|uniref:Uncharacterized protein n=1 Tax=Thermoactinomyces intermedius TaxID=2024 RepID=A0A8I1DFN3_THEIN|nr:MULTISPECIES: hypothetical protein [Thermoactinomyces]MBA4549259.1 hypothetical protein [Thermoactinomyces intermedius]MBA4837054.1 hypothetical protein [Thermoactinomyces intermedius]MBH8595725.1 hypothetical protein [Thermoactinomyces intermedius]QCV56275.1 hypothetical protein FA954_12000 [Thermoactinomyces vulgaris]